MSSKFINQKRLERDERTKEIIKELMECETISEFNAIVEFYKPEITGLKLRRNIADAIRRLNAIEINKSFNYKN